METLITRLSLNASSTFIWSCFEEGGDRDEVDVFESKSSNENEKW